MLVASGGISDYTQIRHLVGRGSQLAGVRDANDFSSKWKVAYWRLVNTAAFLSTNPQCERITAVYPSLTRRYDEGFREPDCFWRSKLTLSRCSQKLDGN